MSISLKNHEDRIKVLEKANGWNSVTNSNGTAYWDPISGFGFCTGVYPTFKVGQTYTITFPKAFQNVPKVPFCQVYSHGEYGTYYENFAKNITTNNFQVSVSRGNSTYVQMDSLSGYLAFGLLKLYYSFSYNIIYRATHLLEKIFLCLKQRRC